MDAANTASDPSPPKVVSGTQRVSCETFSTQAEAQEYFELTQRRSLDPNGNGLACEDVFN
ncbi:MAG: hypothetical protein F6K19_36290 [Cyanothece sp. SIO1E1]|nr:hypothetical protein [Cyanothece sp. SIO1E1]